MDKILISVIIPAYNIAPYIGRCLDSLIMQEHTNIEIIVVNDGSMDDTGEIINRYAKRDSRIKPIHKENGGVTSARIAGIQASKGTYIGFVDGDDYVDSDMFRRLLKNALKYNADISHCGYKMVFPNHVDYYYDTGRLVEQNKITGLKDLLEGSFIEPCLCNKLIHNSLFHNLLNDNLMPQSVKNNEDVLMNYWLFKEANRSIYEDFCPYHYILRKGSAATSKLNEHKLKDPILVTKIMLNDSEKMLDVYNILMKRLVRQLVDVSTMGTTEKYEWLVIFQKQVRKELRELSNSYLIDSEESLLFKIKLLWATYFPTSYRWVHTLYSKITGLDKKYEIEE